MTSAARRTRSSSTRVNSSSICRRLARADRAKHRQPKNQHHHENHEEKEEKEFGDADGRTRDTAETQRAGDEAEEQEDEGPFQHEDCSRCEKFPHATPIREVAFRAKFPSAQPTSISPHDSRNATARYGVLARQFA